MLPNPGSVAELMLWDSMDPWDSHGPIGFPWANGIPTGSIESLCTLPVHPALPLCLALGGIQTVLPRGHVLEGVEGHPARVTLDFRGKRRAIALGEQLRGIETGGAEFLQALAQEPILPVRGILLRHERARLDARSALVEKTHTSSGDDLDGAVQVLAGRDTVVHEDRDLWIPLAHFQERRQPLGQEHAIGINFDRPLVLQVIALAGHPSPEVHEDLGVQR
mmetsp:Transcript_10501/g.32859  ORF Transcript_10501/g.32859 Transcript_10501/m.32859 type:complete len:221 (+) Transcript_10501:168-830(+)